ncbi:Translation machinery-associated protein 46 [Balamuthia mandrillaris]
MPPKKSAGGKAQQKKQEKIIEDKTFGMKNKNKSKKVQKFITQIKTQQTNQRKGPPTEPGKTKKQIKLERDAEFNQLFKPVAQKKVSAGADPKSVLCQYFKMGTCTKGARCKFSHDIAVERKSEKIDIYTDRRDLSGQENMDETMDDWDEGKLRTVVERKAGKNPPTTTDIVCKYFLDAIESRKYGWFWECPNGKDCKYRHALPPGFVFEPKKKKNVEEDEENKVALEDQLEEERRGLTGGTPLTLELFLQWKEKKAMEREDLVEKRKQDIKAGKILRSGREFFVENPELAGVGDDDDAWDTSTFANENEEENGEQVSASAATTTKENGEEEKGKQKEGEEKGEEGANVEVDASVFLAEEVDDLGISDEEEEGEDN